MIRISTIAWLAIVLAPAATAAPYWVAWEGNDYPENEGWERGHYGSDGPAADRSLSDGIMTLDGLASIEIIDGYGMNRPLDPEPGEQFVARWRLRVNKAHGHPSFLYDPGFGVYSDDGWFVSLLYGVDEVYGLLDHQSASFEPYRFHTWEFRSPDMRTYSLYLDGSLLQTGAFVQVVTQSHIEWGDLVAGSTSHAEWDYFRFGVVPEPGSAALLVVLLMASALVRCGPRISRIPTLACLVVGVASNALATPYWVAYEGDDFPENEGWERTFTDPNGVVGQGGAIRTLEAGNLVIDSREDVLIVDFYNMHRPIDPEPGETFIMRWRLRVDDIPSSVPYDLSIGVFSDVFGAVGFQFAEDGLRSVFETREKIPYASGVFHAFEFVSPDMVDYELHMDGALFVSGSFDPVVTGASRVGWGDGIQGARSLSTWDRFAFGVVPEPPGSFLVTVLLILITQSRRFGATPAANGGYSNDTRSCLWSAWHSGRCLAGNSRSHHRMGGRRQRN